MPEAKRVTITSMYLEDDAKLWWRSRLQEHAKAQQHAIETWDMFKLELKRLLLGNASWLAKESFKKLQHTGFVRDYDVAEA